MPAELPKPKKLTHVEVPPDLRQFLQEVAEKIDQRDEDTLVESDDLLQCDFVYGGLADEETGEYGFTYFPGKSRKTKWEILLLAQQIREIADGERDLSLWACEDQNCGSMFWRAEERCSQCDYEREVRALPSGDFSSRRDWALAYFALHPDAYSMQMIGDYNGNTELGETLGYFSLNEATELERIAQSLKRN